MSPARHLTRFVLGLAALTAGCEDRLAPVSCDGGSCGSQSSWRKTYQRTVNRKIDILFVVDDTPAIAPHAGALATGYQEIARALESLPLTEPASLHVGFVRAGGCDRDTRGAACGLTAPEPFMRWEWCGTTTNFGGAFESTFACLADFGAANCTPAQPLRAALRTLTANEERPGWETFLRPDAYLMIVVIAGADDASSESPPALTPVSEIVGLLHGYKQDPSQLLASVIVPQRCTAGGNPVPRLAEFVGALGANGALVDLCDGRPASALDRVASLLTVFDDFACVANVRDTDPNTPGLQADCVFEDRVIEPDGTWTARALPSCDAAGPPCWRLIPGAAGCGATANGIQIDRGADWCDEAGEYVTLECLACADPRDPACTPQP